MPSCVIRKMPKLPSYLDVQACVYHPKAKLSKDTKESVDMPMASGLQDPLDFLGLGPGLSQACQAAHTCCGNNDPPHPPLRALEAASFGP